MSGVEVIAVLSVTSLANSIIEASKQIYDAARNAQGIPDAFRKVSENMPLVLNTLRDAKKIQLRAVADYKQSADATEKQAIEESANAVKPLLSTCQGNAQKLQDIFEEVIPGDDARRLERYWRSVQTPGKKRKVEDLMKEILEKLQLLYINQFFKGQAQSAALDAAIGEISRLSPSLPDDDSHYNHFGPGPMNINAGAGSQRNYTQSGGSGTMFNAETQNFRDGEP